MVIQYNYTLPFKEYNSRDQSFEICSCSHPKFSHDYSGDRKCFICMCPKYTWETDVSSLEEYLKKKND